MSFIGFARGTRVVSAWSNAGGWGWIDRIKCCGAGCKGVGGYWGGYRAGCRAGFVAGCKAGC
jgi:hypothetical protein